MKGRLKPRLHRQNPPPRVEEWAVKIRLSFLSRRPADIVCIEAVSTAVRDCGYSIAHQIIANCWAHEYLVDRTRIGKLPERLFRPWNKPDRRQKQLRYKSRDRPKS